MTRRHCWHLVCIATLLASLAERPATAEEPTPDSVYLFSYFVDNGQDGLHLAWSDDGLQWQAVGGGRLFLAPEIGRDKLMRDPSIVRGPDGTFHMVWTTSWHDLGIGYAHSRGLLHWSKQQFIPVMTHEPTARNCWVPELFFDQASGRYFILWSSTIPDRFPQTAGTSEDEYNHRVYYTTTTDFQTFTPTKLYFDPGHSVIDAFLARQGDTYLLFYKDETRFPAPKKTIHLATSPTPDGPFAASPTPIIPRDWVEGPAALAIGRRWLVYFDCYTKGHYGAAASEDLQQWTDITDQIRFPDGTRHGTALRIDRATLDRLQWPEIVRQECSPRLRRGILAAERRATLFAHPARRYGCRLMSCRR